MTVLMLFGTLALANVQAGASTGTWDGGIAIQKDANNAFNPFVAQSSNGNKIMVWTAVDSLSNDFVYYSMYDPTTGWSWPGVLASGGSFDFPQVGMGDDGRAVACWVGDFGESHVYSRVFVPGTGWGDVFDHGKTDSVYWRQLRLAVNGEGDALLAHESLGAIARSVEVWTYDSGTGWDSSSDVLQTVPTAEDLDGIFVTLSDSGRAAAIWQHFDTENRVMVSTRTIAGAWGLPEELDINDMWTQWLRVGIDDSSGEFMATFMKNTGSSSIAYFSVTDAGSWSTPSPVPGMNNTASWSQNMVMNGDGTAMVVTTDYNNPNFSVNATMYIDGNWTPVDTLASNLTGLFYPELAIDELGRAVVTFTIDNDRVAAVYEPAEGWTNTVPVEINAAGSTFTAASVSMESGSILIGYSLYQDRGIIWASMYEFPDTTPPSLNIDQTSGETERPLFEITGTTEPGAQVDVNGNIAAVSDSGEFSIVVELSAGANSLVVTATDDAGNDASQTLTVTYNDPLPVLEEEMNGLQDLIDAQQDEMDQLNDELDAANEKIGDLESTSFLYGILGIAGLVVAIVALALALVRRKG